MTTEPTTEHPGEAAMQQTGLGHLLFSFDGRARRSAYLIWFVVCFVAAVIAQLMASSPDDLTPRLVLVLILLWPSLAIAIKRFHDRDKSGWWVLLGLIPIIGPIWLLIELGFLPGTPGPNRFGGPLNGF
jgi:uncharacterized membrane protein YhaH (DUF805 family)